MPEANLTNLNLDGLTPAELEARRREIVSDLQTKYKGYNDPEVPVSLLHELVAITSTLRRRNAGPPKARRPATRNSKTTIDDLLNL